MNQSTALSRILAAAPRILPNLLLSLPEVHACLRGPLCPPSPGCSSPGHASSLPAAFARPANPHSTSASVQKPRWPLHSPPSPNAASPGGPRRPRGLEPQLALYASRVCVLCFWHFSRNNGCFPNSGGGGGGRNISQEVKKRRSSVTILQRELKLSNQ